MKKPASGKDVRQFDRNMREQVARSEVWDWYSPARHPSLRIAGFAWSCAGGYRRMPRLPLPAGVDFLANHTAGGQLRFTTDSKRIILRATLPKGHLMDHMAPTAQRGFDCYVGSTGKTCFHSTARFPIGKWRFDMEIGPFPTHALRTLTFNFPLYGGVKTIRIGLEPGAALCPPPPYQDERPIVIYGTSITQGGCASRPGLCWSNILSRRINRPFINLGFSGSGRGEAEVARIIAAIPAAALFILDFEANTPSFRDFRKSLPRFIRLLRTPHPGTPILVVSKTPYAAELLDPACAANRRMFRLFQAAVVKKLRSQGDRRIFFFDGSGLFPRYPDECTVDGAHPNDLGFMQIADTLGPVVKKLLA